MKKAITIHEVSNGYFVKFITPVQTKAAAAAIVAGRAQQVQQETKDMVFDTKEKLMEFLVNNL